MSKFIRSTRSTVSTKLESLAAPPVNFVAGCNRLERRIIAKQLRQGKKPRNWQELAHNQLNDV